MKIDLTNLLFPFKKIDLTNPHLGSELLENPKGDFPLDVWEAYCYETLPSLVSIAVLPWRVDPSDPKTAALDPQQAVDEASDWVIQTVLLLKSHQPAEALASARRALQILNRGLSSAQPKHGQPPSMRPIAVRAWIIRKFNPPSEVRWGKLANLLFLEKGKKCPRCGLTKHQYDSACVKALRTNVARLVSAMKPKRIPI